MADDYFDAKLALNPETGNVVAGAVAQVFAPEDSTFSTPLEITDLAGVPLGALIASPTGIYPPFRVVSGLQDVYAKSGPVITPITSREGSRGAPGAPGTPGIGVPPLADGTPGQVVMHDGTGTRWGDPAGSGGGSGIIGAPARWPDSFPPQGHQHTASQISDSTTVGRRVMTAADEQAARAAIGAAPSTVTSFPGFGSTSDRAARGDHTHGASSIDVTPVAGTTATNVQDSLAQIAAIAGGGGGGGTSGIRLVIYKSGAYPAQPDTAPAGTLVRFFFGPTPYQGAVWPGVIDIHFRAELT